MARYSRSYSARRTTSRRSYRASSPRRSSRVSQRRAPARQRDIRIVIQQAPVPGQVTDLQSLMARPVERRDKSRL